jgi:methylmalonyl-CoA mutase
MLRGTTAAMAAVLGGCDVLSVRAYDAALRPPDRFGTRIARNLQHLLKHEAHLDLVDDPAAGAYFLEAVTDQLARRAWGAFQEVEASGGLLAALQAGRVQSAIGDVRTRRIQAVDDRNRVLVGTNHYPNVEEQRSLELNDELICNNRSEYRIEWGSRPLDELHSRLDAGASIPALAAALAADDAHEIDPLPRVRVAEGIEQVRRRTEQAASRPRILIAPIGPPGPRSARATFARHFFGVAGFDVKSPLRFETPDEAAAEAARESAAVVALCSADTEYASLAPALRAALHAHNCSPLLVVAGHPSQISDQVTADWFIHRHSSLRQTLEAIQDRLALSPLDESSS